MTRLAAAVLLSACSLVNSPSQFQGGDGGHVASDAGADASDASNTDASDAAVDCADGTRSSDGTRCFIVASTDTWDNARRGCSMRGGYLATIASDSEQLELKIIADDVGMPVWIGATDDTTEGAWRWTNGEPWGFIRWATGQPDNSGGAQNCATLWPAANGEWDDASCTSRFPAICEVEL